MLVRSSVTASTTLALLLVACQSAPTPGAACASASDCASPLACRFGHCRTACAADRDCGANASCLLDPSGVGACSLDVDLGCQTGVGRACASGLACVGDRCVQTCDATQGCATGSVCTPLPGAMLSFCFDPSVATPDAGVTGDAGVDAAPAPIDAGASGVRAVCVGGTFVCAAIEPTGATYCWGQDAALGLGFEPGAPHATGCDLSAGNSDHPLEVGVVGGAALTNVDALACGGTWACAHVASGEVLCWGNSYEGQLAPGVTNALCDREAHDTSVRYTNGELVAREHLACAVDGDVHTATCWGGDQGTIHPGDAVPTPPVTPLPSMTPIDASLTGAVNHPIRLAIANGMIDPQNARGGGCIVDSDGQVSCWGGNRVGQTSADPAMTTVVPAVSPDDDPTLHQLHGSDVAVGRDFACAIDNVGYLVCWGANDVGQLAHPLSDTSLASCPLVVGSAVPCSHLPLRNMGLRLVAITSDTTMQTACGASMDHHAYCWGSGDYGVSGSTSGLVDDPIAAGPIRRSDTHQPITEVVSVSMAFENACALTSTGELWCWGANDYGQLGPSATSPTVEAVRISVP